MRSMHYYMEIKNVASYKISVAVSRVRKASKITFRRFYTRCHLYCSGNVFQSIWRKKKNHLLCRHIFVEQNE